MSESLHERLIVLASQPRSGSTLLQRMLGRLPAVYTHSEPWILLHPLYALRRSGYTAEYNEELARQGLDDFISTLPAGEADYFTAIRKMATYLYDQVLKETGSKYYLDKTPRYHRILPEIARTFPNARLIVLHRHPMGVLTSMVKTWGMGSLPFHVDDLLDAPHRLLTFRQRNSSRIHTVWYEQLVRAPEETLRSICAFLDIEFHPDAMVLTRSEERWALGDQGNVYRLSEPTPAGADRWRQSLSDPQIWRLASDYFEFLGSDLVQALGYSAADTGEALRSARPPMQIERVAVPLSVALTPPSWDRRLRAFRSRLASRLGRNHRIGG